MHSEIVPMYVKRMQIHSESMHLYFESRQVYFESIKMNYKRIGLQFEVIGIYFETIQMHLVYVYEPRCISSYYVKRSHEAAVMFHRGMIFLR